MSPESGIQRRYSDKEIGRLLSLAVRLQEREEQTAAPVRESPSGFSLEDLQQVAAEVGIEPRHVLAAARALDAEAAERTPLLGAPATWETEHAVAGEMSAADWEEFVAAIRRTFGQPGLVGTVGSSYEWQGAGGCASVTISPGSGKTRIRIALRNQGIMVLSYLFPTLAAIITAGAVSEELLHMPGLAELAISGGIVGTFWGIVRASLHAWFCRKTHAVRELVARLEELMRGNVLADR
jgi:hypothetical protein